MRSSPGAALRSIPGWESASWTAIDGGRTNTAWRVETGGRDALLKIDGKPRGIPFADRLEEARVQSAAARQGLANRVLFASETVLLTEFRDGSVWTRRSLGANHELIRLARAVRRVHALPLTGRRFDAVAAAESYVTRVGDADPTVARQYLQTIRTIPVSRQVCCCHNDLVAENILEAGGIRFLDWEYAADNDPLFDLATVVAHHGLDDSQAGVLLDAYFDGDGARWRKPLAGQVRLYRALCWLWEAAEG